VVDSEISGKTARRSPSVTCPARSIAKPLTSSRLGSVAAGPRPEKDRSEAVGVRRQTIRGRSVERAPGARIFGGVRNGPRSPEPAYGRRGGAAVAAAAPRAAGDHQGSRRRRPIASGTDGVAPRGARAAKRHTRREPLRGARAASRSGARPHCQATITPKVAERGQIRDLRSEGRHPFDPPPASAPGTVASAWLASSPSRRRTGGGRDEPGQNGSRRARPRRWTGVTGRSARGTRAQRRSRAILESSATTVATRSGSTAATAFRHPAPGPPQGRRPKAPGRSQSRVRCASRCGRCRPRDRVRAHAASAEAGSSLRHLPIPGLRSADRDP